jgi:hypothetical protein
MSTVPKADTPAPADNSNKTLVSDSWSGNYGRPTSGGAPLAGNPAGNPPNEPAPGPTPGYSINMTGAPVSAAGTQAGPDMGQGATIVIPASGDRPSGGKDAADSGTVGSSGPQGAGPGTQ